MKGRLTIKSINPASWGWVDLKELGDAIGQSPAETWENFFALSKDIAKDCLAWSPDMREVYHDNRDYPPTGQAFVPAGWALDVLKAHDLGAVRANIVFHRHVDRGDPCPEGATDCHFNGFSGFLSGCLKDATGNPVPWRSS